PNLSRFETGGRERPGAEHHKIPPRTGRWSAEAVLNSTQGASAQARDASRRTSRRPYRRISAADSSTSGLTRRSLEFPPIWPPTRATLFPLHRLLAKNDPAECERADSRLRETGAPVRRRG